MIAEIESSSIARTVTRGTKLCECNRLAVASGHYDL